MASGEWREWGERLAAPVGELSASILFLTRLPLPRHEGAGGAAGHAVWRKPSGRFRSRAS